MLIMLGALIAQVNTNPYTTSALNAIEFCSLFFTVFPGAATRPAA